MKSFAGWCVVALFATATLTPNVVDAVPYDTALQMCNNFADSKPGENRESFIARCMGNMTIDKASIPNSGASSDSFSVFIGLAFAFIVGGALYFIPTIVAYSSNRPNRAAILILNLFLGWTFLGWVIALVWAMMHSPEQRSA